MANVSSFTGAMPVIPGGLVELLNYEKTSSVVVSNATPGTGTEVIPAQTVTTDGGPILIEFSCYGIQPASTTDDYIVISLFEDGVEKLREWADAFTPAAATLIVPVNASFRTTPSAGTHTYSVRAYVKNAARSGYVYANSVTSGRPMSLRISKIVNQNDGLKPFWTPPVVTQLPSQATVGDQVIYAADATNGVYWHLQYDGLGTYPWKFIGGAPLWVEYTGDEAIASTAFTSFTNGPTLTIPAAGDYMISWGGAAAVSVAGAQGHLAVKIGSTTPADNTTAIGASDADNRSGVWTTRRCTGIASNTAVVMQARLTSGQINVSNRRITATPIRVSA